MLKAWKLNERARMFVQVFLVKSLDDILFMKRRQWWKRHGSEQASGSGSGGGESGSGTVASVRDCVLLSDHYGSDTRTNMLARCCAW